MAAADTKMASDASPSKAAQGIKALNLNLGGRKSSAGTGGRGSDTGSAGINMPREHEELVKPVFDKYADKAGMLPVAKLGDFLAELKLSTSTDASQNVLNIVAGKSDTLTLDQTLDMYDMLKSMSSLRSSEAGGSSVSSRMRKFLSQRKDYLQTGYVAYDETVLSYIRKLDEHRRKCEATGKYQEAKATMARLAELKTAQAEQMRLGLVQNQAGELQEIERVFEEETTKFNKYWEQRIAMYELGFKKHLELMQASHDTALDNLCNDLEASRPSQAKPSSAYLSLRERERVLIKSRLYDEAEALKTTTDMLYSAELDQTIAEYDAQAQLKVARLQTKQQHDLEALLQRGSMGRDELELKRQQQEQRRRNRLRAVISELESLHKLEVVQLECFLDGQALAGKAVPLADGYHRKREIIYTNFARELEL